MQYLPRTKPERSVRLLPSLARHASHHRQPGRWSWYSAPTARSFSGAGAGNCWASWPRASASGARQAGREARAVGAGRPPRLAYAAPARAGSRLLSAANRSWGSADRRNGRRAAKEATPSFPACADVSFAESDALGISAPSSARGVERVLGGAAGMAEGGEAGGGGSCLTLELRRPRRGWRDGADKEAAAGDREGYRVDRPSRLESGVAQAYIRGADIRACSRR